MPLKGYAEGKSPPQNGFFSLLPARLVVQRLASEPQLAGTSAWKGFSGGGKAPSRPPRLRGYKGLDHATGEEIRP